MINMLDWIVPIVGILLAAGGLFYGCIKVHPASTVRWLIYAAVAFVSVELVAMPVLPMLNLAMTITDQTVAIIGMTFGNEVVMERILPWWL